MDVGTGRQLTNGYTKMIADCINANAYIKIEYNLQSRFMLL